MQQRLERLLDRALERHTTQLARVDPKWHPCVDAYETEEEFVVIVDLSGMSEESIDITYREPDLRISGSRSGAHASGRIKFHQKEINYGPFERIIRIGAPVSPDLIRAQYTNGFLTIQIPKSRKRTIIKVERDG